MTSYPERVTIVESGPRDGLQAEKTILSVAERISLIEKLLGAGASRIEVASFVHPGRVPQMAGAEEILAALPIEGDASYSGLVLNRRGLERAFDTVVDEVGFVVAASDGYNTSNQGATVAETLGELETMIPDALADGRFASVTISVAFGCPYDGEVGAQRVADIARRVVDLGAMEIALGDTIGVAVPTDVTERLALLRAVVPDTPLRCHFHDTRGTALANAYAAMAAGVKVLDTSVGGLGGSPFAPGAGGNLATEDLVYSLDRAGIETGIDLGAVIAVGRDLGHRLGHDLDASLQHVEPWP
jgi:hydroxymethylglutaryl-CoA lyase